eukprot:TRINITY_DN11701_c0_g1_i1.p1 TRINITY_DN11701_c0_g1~~TRINITY_DN11701_c0_g1_i1.p1  ORF type:complete len:187 (-),score=63.93 TRINITY_DN11701_c0_g1_i1:392-952(-)
MTSEASKLKLKTKLLLAGGIALAGAAATFIYYRFFRKSENKFTEIADPDQLSEKQIGEIFDHYDSNHDSELDLKECALLCKHLMRVQLQASREQMEKLNAETRLIFQKTYDSMVRMTKELMADDKLMDTLANDMVKLLDTNKDGKVKKEEFVSNFRTVIGNVIKDYREASKQTFKDASLASPLANL